MRNFLLLLLGALLVLPASARDFTFTYEGQTLTYTVLSETDKTVSVGVDPMAYMDIEGDLKIPSSITDPKGDVYTVTEFGEEAFYGCDGLNSVIIPETVTTIGNAAFAYCHALKSVTIPESVTAIGAEAFENCSSLSSLTLPESVITIGESAFCNCDGLTSIVIPKSVTHISNSTFSDCIGLMSVTIPNSVLEIGESAFASCFNLTTLWIGNSVTEIGDYAFKNCYRLSAVYYCSANPASASHNVFSDAVYHSSDAVLYVPEEAVEQCKMISPWDYFQNVRAYDFNAGVDQIKVGSDENALCEIFTLAGIKVSAGIDTLAPGVYIVRQGCTVNKTIIR